MTEGYRITDYGQPVMRYVQTMKLKDDPALIARYKARHSREQHWPIVCRGIREVGILDMQVYLCGTTLVMIVDAPVGFDWDAAMARLATLPGQQEWEESMAEFQVCDKNATSNEKWQMMERIFHIYENEE